MQGSDLSKITCDQLPSRGNRYGRFLPFILDSTQRQASLRLPSPTREAPRNAPEHHAVPRFSLRNALELAVDGSAALEIASIASIASIAPSSFGQRIGRRAPPRRRQNRGNRRARHRVPIDPRGRRVCRTEFQIEFEFERGDAGVDRSAFGVERRSG